MSEVVTAASMLATSDFELTVTVGSDGARVAIQLSDPFHAQELLIPALCAGGWGAAATGTSSVLWFEVNPL